MTDKEESQPGEQQDMSRSNRFEGEMFTSAPGTDSLSHLRKGWLGRPTPDTPGYTQATSAAQDKPNPERKGFSLVHLGLLASALAILASISTSSRAQ